MKLSLPRFRGDNVRRATRCSACSETDCSVALSGLDQEDLPIGKSCEDVTEAKAPLGTGGPAIGCRAQRRTLAVLGEPRFLKIDIVAHVPFALLIKDPGQVALARSDRLKISLAPASFSGELGWDGPEPGWECSRRLMCMWGGH